jgi:hypothetical protein
MARKNPRKQKARDAYRVDQVTHRAHQTAYFGEMRSFACKPNIFYPKHQLEAFRDVDAIITCVYCLTGGIAK